MEKNGKYSYIETFFTTKGENLYCIIPKLTGTVFILKDFKLRKSTKAGLLDSDRALPIKQRGSDCYIDLSDIQIGAAEPELAIIKLEGTL